MVFIRNRKKCISKYNNLLLEKLKGIFTYNQAVNFFFPIFRHSFFCEFDMNNSYITFIKKINRNYKQPKSSYTLKF